MNHDALIINYEYCGTCRGHCTTCALTTEERATATPFLDAAQMHTALIYAASQHPQPSMLALGIGRADVLALADQPPQAVRDILVRAADLFSGVPIIAEVATSLVGGKLDTYVRRARDWSATLGHAAPPVTVRFAIMANLELHSASYWRNVRGFLDQLAEWRGGADGSGDILNLNISASRLPGVADVIRRLDGIRSPINVLWNPVAQPDIRRHLDLLGLWLAEFYQAAQSAGMDCNLINLCDLPTPSAQEAIAQIADHPATLISMDRHGQVGEGLFTILGDMDPGRSVGMATHTPVLRRDRPAQVVSDARRESARLLRHRTCRACPHLGRCIQTGGFKLAQVVLQRDPDILGCPTALRPMFDAAETASGGSLHAQAI